MHFNGVNMTVAVSRTELLEKLRTNLAQHQQIVMEAREGYLKKAKQALQERISTLEKGKVVSLNFSLQEPADHSKDYKTAISMLEFAQGETVELQTQDFQRLVNDEWDWSYGFYSSNAAYSESAMTVANSKRWQE